jgi:endoglucanase
VLACRLIVPWIHFLADRRPMNHSRSRSGALRAALATLAVAGACAGESVTGPDELAEKKGPKNSPPAESPAPAPSAPSANPLAGSTLYVDAWSHARRQADLWRSSRPADAAQMDKIAANAQAHWFGNWNGDVSAAVRAVVDAAAGRGAVPVLVAYNIPQRDCGGLSGGNSTAASTYRQWIADFAHGVGARRAVVILEPDALPQMNCLSATDQEVRYDLMRHAVQTLTALGGASVYIDAGHSRWISATEMASRLLRADVARAAGFSLNVSNFQRTTDNVTYGAAVSSQIGGKHYVIDTGRNGLGPTSDNQWCNPDGRALGNRPTTATGADRVDAYLWIKVPGESDGACAGAPAAGTWMPEYALGLAQRAAF